MHPPDPPPSQPSPSATPDPTPPPPAKITKDHPNGVPQPSPSPADAGSSTVSSTGNPATAGRFAIDAGPAHDAEGRPQADPAEIEPLDGEAQVEAEAWSEEVVRNLLKAQGGVTHTFLAVDPDSNEWRHTADDLDAIAPSLTRMLNRHDVTRDLAGAGDEINLVLGLFGYTYRSLKERRAAMQTLRAQAPQPITGVPAPDDVPSGYAYPDDDDTFDPELPRLIPRRR